MNSHPTPPFLTVPIDNAIELGSGNDHGRGAQKTTATKTDFFRHGSFPIKIQSFSARGSRHVFFSIFRVLVFFPSTQTAPVWRGWSADIPRPSDECALRAG